MLLVATSSGKSLFAQHPTSQHYIVWTWSKQCDARRQLKVTVRLESRVLYKGLRPICRCNRYAEKGRAEFHFSSDQVFGGEYRARNRDPIEGDIWQAGGETDGLMLGISLATKKQVMLNTLHLARPDRQKSAELDRGLFITTFRSCLASRGDRHTLPQLRGGTTSQRQKRSARMEAQAKSYPAPADICNEGVKRRGRLAATKISS